MVEDDFTLKRTITRLDRRNRLAVRQASVKHPIGSERQSVRIRVELESLDDAAITRRLRLHLHIGGGQLRRAEENDEEATLPAGRKNSPPLYSREVSRTSV